MNPIQKAISEIRFKIPNDILQAAFVTRSFGQFPRPVSLETVIRERVIDARVMVDCNLTGGIETEIPLIGITPEHLEPGRLVYRIPKTLTQNRSITRTISLAYGSGSAMGTTQMGMQGYSQLLDAASGVMASHAAIPLISTAYVRLIAENTILVEDMTAMPRNVFLRCYVENDASMEQLRSMTYHKFTRLCELAVKSYIYNELVLKINQGQLSGGLEIGRFKEIVDSYADAEELYSNYLQDVWRRVAILDDQRSRERHLRLITGGRH